MAVSVASLPRRVSGLRVTGLISGSVLALALMGDAALHPPAWHSVQRYLPLLSHPQPQRADIIDRNGQLLATSILVPELFADPQLVQDPQATAAALARMLPGLDEVKLAGRLADKSKRFVWVSRNVTQAQRDAVKTLRLPGLAFRDEERRAYPFGSLTVQVLGITNVDNDGISGIEWAEGKRLTRSAAPLKVTLDVQMQETARTILLDAMAQARAAGAAAVVMNLRGQVLALVSLPDYDPASRQMFVPNRASAGLYELGDMSRLFADVLGPPDEPLTETMILAPNRAADRLGLLHRVPLPLETSVPLLDLHRNGSAFDITRNLALTPVHVAAVAAALVNRGDYYAPTLLLPDAMDTTPLQDESVTTLIVSDDMRKQLLSTGVTGIARKVIDGADLPGHVIASAVAAFPAGAPRFVVYAMLDDPQPPDSDGNRATALQAVTRIGARLR